MYNRSAKLQQHRHVCEGVSRLKSDHPVLNAECTLPTSHTAGNVSAHGVLLSQIRAPPLRGTRLEPRNNPRWDGPQTRTAYIAVLETSDASLTRPPFQLDLCSLTSL